MTFRIAIAICGMALMTADTLEAQSGFGLREPLIHANADEYEVTSSNTGRTYLVQVSPPYPVPEGDERLPVVYVLDGKTHFQLAAQTVVNLGRAESMQRRMSWRSATGVR